MHVVDYFPLQFFLQSPHSHTVTTVLVYRDLDL